MYKWCSQIFNALILLIVGIAMIGVNVSRLHCGQCKEVYTKVNIVPEEKSPCPCEHGCSCCSENKKTDGHSETEHSFYKLTDFSQEEKTVSHSFSFFLPVERLFLENVTPEVCVSEYGIDAYKYSDDSPPQEFLCVYRC